MKTLSIIKGEKNVRKWLWCFLQYTSSYESYEAYSSLEEAKEVARDERGIDISNPETRVSLGVGEHGGQNWFVVAPDGIFMDCTVAELDDWEDWYQEDKIDFGWDIFEEGPNEIKEIDGKPVEVYEFGYAGYTIQLYREIELL